MFDFNNLIPEPHYLIHRKSTPHWCIKPSVIPFNDLTYVVQGKAFYTIGDRTVTVKAGDLIYIPCNTFRAATQDETDPLECHSFNFYLYNQDGTPAALDLKPLTHIGNHPKLLRLCHTTNETWSRKDFGFQLEVRGYLCLIINMILNILHNPVYANNNMDIRIQHAITYINSHYAEALCINDLAEFCNLSPTYYGNLFQKTTGQSFKHYLNLVRLNHAETMLQSGEYCVNEAALHCGFSDVFYFSKLFKKYKGINPSSVSKCAN